MFELYDRAKETLLAAGIKECGALVNEGSVASARKTPPGSYAPNVNRVPTELRTNCLGISLANAVIA